MKKLFILVLILTIALVATIWPPKPSQAQITDHRSPITDSLAKRETAVENKIDSSKAVIYKEIDRLKAAKPRIVVRNHVRTVYRDVPTVIFIDTCLPKMPMLDFPEPVPEKILFPEREPRNPFFKRLINKILHGKKD